MFVWGLTQPESDLYVVPLRIYGKKPLWRSHSRNPHGDHIPKRCPSERVMESLGSENPSRISSKVYPLWPNLPVKDVSHGLASCHEMSFLLLHPSSRVSTGKQNEALSYFGNWMLVDWMSPAHPCSLSSGSRAKGTSRSHLLADDLLGRETRWECSLGVLCWYNFHGVKVERAAQNCDLGRLEDPLEP